MIKITESNYKSLGWDSRMHNHGKAPSKTSIGNVAEANGSVATMRPTNLQGAFRYEVFADFPNRLAIP